MKPHFFALPLLVLSSRPVLAQAPAAPPTTAVAPAKPSPLTMDPAVRSIVERAIVERSIVERAIVERSIVERAIVERSIVERAIVERSIVERALSTYKGASGIRYSYIDGKTGTRMTVHYRSPGQMRVDGEHDGKPTRYLIDGNDSYRVLGDEYHKSVNPVPGMSPLSVGMAGDAGQLLAALMAGQDPFEATRDMFAQPPFEGFKMSTVALGTRVVEGEVLQGIRCNFSFLMPGAPEPVRVERTVWFGGSPFALRRVQSRNTFPSITATISEKIVEQQLSPEFPEDTFVFDPTGLKLQSPKAPLTAPRSRPEYDPRLKVGAAPLPLSTNDLKGQPISLAKYKGKVVLLDFWATWCAPCVKGLPELKGAYDKYHAKGFEVVGISLDENKGALTSFIKKNKMAWPQIFDGKGWNSQVSTDYGVRAIPFLLLVGKDGKIAAVNPRGKVEAAVKAALAVR